MAEAAARGRPYVHSPADDMWSFYWTTLWAVLHNKDARHDSPLENALREELSGTWQQRTLVGARLRPSKRDHSPLLVALGPFLKAWHAELSELEASAVDFSQGMLEPAIAEDRKSWLVTCHLYAYRGVAAFLRVLRKHSDAIKDASGSSSA